MRLKQTMQKPWHLSICLMKNLLTHKDVLATCDKLSNMFMIRIYIQFLEVEPKQNSSSLIASNL